MAIEQIRPFTDFATGFEDDNLVFEFSEVVGDVSQVIYTTGSVWSKQALQVVVTPGNASYVKGSDNIGQYPRFTFRLYIDTLPTVSSCELMRIEAEQCLILRSSGRLAVVTARNDSYGPTDILLESNSALSTGRWYTIGWNWSRNGVGAVEIRIDGIPDAVTSFGGTSTAATGLYMGEVRTAHEENALYLLDDVVVTWTHFIPQDYGIFALRPVADGTYRDWTGCDPGYYEVLQSSSIGYVENRSASSALDMTVKFDGPQDSIPEWVNVRDMYVYGVIMSYSVGSDTYTSTLRIFPIFKTNHVAVFWVPGTYVTIPLSERFPGLYVGGDAIVFGTDPSTGEPLTLGDFMDQGMELGLRTHPTYSAHTQAWHLCAQVIVGTHNPFNTPILNFSGFETGDTSELESTTGVISVQGTIYNSGSYALRCNPGTGQTGYGVFPILHHRGILTNPTYDVSGTTYAITNAYLSTYFMIVTAPATSSEPIFRFGTSGNNLAFYLGSDCKLYAYKGTTSLSAASSVLTPGVWYNLCFYQEYSPTSGVSTSWALYINGMVNIQGTTEFAHVPVHRCYLGKYSNTANQAIDIYFDDVVWRADGPQELPYNVGVILPNDDGTYNTEWDGNIGGYTSLPVYLAIDDVPNDGDSSFAYPKNVHAVNAVVTWHHENTALNFDIVPGVKALKMHALAKGYPSSNYYSIGLYGNGLWYFTTYETISQAGYLTTREFLLPYDYTLSGTSAMIRWKKSTVDQIEMAAICALRNSYPMRLTAASIHVLNGSPAEKPMIVYQLGG